MSAPSDIDRFHLYLDLFEAHQCASARAGANTFSFPPGCRTLEIRFPEGPGLALAGAHRVDTAAARFCVQKGTISVALFSQGKSVANRTGMETSHLDRRLPKIVGDFLNLLFFDPHHSRITAATVATLRAVEAKPVFVPGFPITHTKSVAAMGVAKQWAAGNCLFDNSGEVLVDACRSEALAGRMIAAPG